jgi:2'-5' RNA ligase
MGCQSNGAHRSAPAEERLNIFALVIYIPDPLGRFLDDLRRELVPAYNPHAHVSVLPPRPLAVDWREASRRACALSERWAPFEIELTSIGIFPVTNVVYVEVGKGAAELTQIHRSMNADAALHFEEPFQYHPHTTLAQEIPQGSVAGVYELAKRRWSEYQGARSFRAEHAVFVQNTLQNCWIDLAEYSFGAIPAKI